MSARSLHSSPDREPAREVPSTMSYYLAWACLPVMLVLSGLLLLLFGLTWWTALVVVLLLTCPAVIAVTIYFGFHPMPGYRWPDRRDRTQRHEDRPGAAR